MVQNIPFDGLVSNVAFRGACNVSVACMASGITLCLCT